MELRDEELTSKQFSVLGGFQLLFHTALSAAVRSLQGFIC